MDCENCWRIAINSSFLIPMSGCVGGGGGWFVVIGMEWDEVPCSTKIVASKTSDTSQGSSG